MDVLQNPRRVGFLPIDGFALMSLASVAEPLRAANLLSGKALYDLVTFAADDLQATSSGMAVVPATAALTDAGPLDMLFVIAGGDPASYQDRSVFDWLGRQARRGVQICGISGGPVILARAGLMAGRRMTVHWEHAEALAEVSPDLLIERSLYVMDRDRVTCAGGTAPMDLMHALISDHHGPVLARRVSDWFLYTDIRPAGDPQRSGLVARVGSTSRPVLDAVAAMESHVADPLDLGQLAEIAGVTERHLNRMFARETGKSTMIYYRDLRLGKAADLMRNSPLLLTEIALATGFGSSAHLSRSFRALHGHPPSDLRRSRTRG